MVIAIALHFVLTRYASAHPRPRQQRKSHREGGFLLIGGGAEYEVACGMKRITPKQCGPMPRLLIAVGPTALQDERRKWLGNLATAQGHLVGVPDFPN